jgi:UDP-glucose 4-epimerase
MRVLVTGGNGFIGGHVLDRLIEQGHEPAVFDRYGRPHRSDVPLIMGDIRRRDTIRAAIEEVDGVINLAGILGTSETIDQPSLTVHSNILGALHVFEACRDFHKRAVHITVGNHWMNNPYSITKSAAERFALTYNREFGAQIAVVRGLNAYGPRQKPWPVRKIMPNLAIPALSGGEILIYGDGEQLMDMIFVRDLADVLIRALTVDHRCYSSIFEAGMGAEYTPTINQLAQLVVRQSGSGCRITHVPMRAGEPERSKVIGNPQTLQPLGLSAASLMSLDEGVKETLKWYRAHLGEFHQPAAKAA